MKIGEVTGWLRTAALAGAAGIPLSSHLFPEISAHLLAVSPTRHWLEYVDWAGPILERQLDIEDGYASTPEEAGIGMSCDVGAVQRFRWVIRSPAKVFPDYHAAWGHQW